MENEDQEDLIVAEESSDAKPTAVTAAPTQKQSNNHVFSPELLKMYYARLFPYDFMHRIDHDNFIVLVNRILEKMCYLVKEQLKALSVLAPDLVQPVRV